MINKPNGIDLPLGAANQIPAPVPPKGIDGLNFRREGPWLMLNDWTFVNVRLIEGVTSQAMQSPLNGQMVRDKRKSVVFCGGGMQIAFDHPAEVVAAELAKVMGP